MSNGKKKKMKKMVCAAAAGMMTMSFIMPAFAQDTAITPKKAVYGYYVDEYQKNEEDGIKDTLQNPAIGVLSEMLDYFTPGTAWDNGTILNSAMHEMNLKETAKINQNSTQTEKELAFYDDLHDGNYSMISGLGIYADEFKKGTNAKTSVTEIPADADTVKYSDAYKDNGKWADADSTYGGIVELVTALRNGAASTSPAKKYYKYMRPFRWSRLNGEYPQTTIISSLKPQEKADPSNDGGYPSGHTNGANLAAIAMAYAVPQQYSQMMLRSSELGNSRIVAGMHSCLDVIGGRMMSTAIAAANLNAEDNAAVKAKAVADGQKLVETVGAASDYESYQKDKETYLYRMTYNLKLDNADTTKEMVVPKGAEVLLETRFPYLSADERRYVLYTTGISSGYSVLDDAEGWGRLNLFEASNGYGAFATDVTVDMDAEKGGFCAADNWRNDIDGSGSLTKQGSGMLVLSGDNSYTGGTTVEGGTIRADYDSAFGDGNVVNNSTITENTTGTLAVHGNFTQNQEGVLEVTVSNEQDYIAIDGTADLGGKLVVNFTDGYLPENGFDLLKSTSLTSQFDEIVVNAPQDFDGSIVYTDNGVEVRYQTVEDHNGQNSGQQENSNADSSQNTGNRQEQSAGDNAAGTAQNSGLQTENANTAVKKADTPVKTADTANIWTCLLLMASSAATAAGIGAKRLNKNKNKQ